MDMFNVIAGAVTIASFVFALIVYYREKALKRHLEAGFLSLIGILDKTAAMGYHKDYSKSRMSTAVECARDQCVGLLKSFSDREERLPTYDFGIKGENMKETVRKRKEATGLSGSGCVVEGQHIQSTSGTVRIESLSLGDAVRSYDERSARLIDAKIEAISSHSVKNYLMVNDSLAITANHEVFCRYRGWIDSSCLTVGDELLKVDLEWESVKSLRVEEVPATAYAVSTSVGNLFSSGYLVHNIAKAAGV